MSRPMTYPMGTLEVGEVGVVMHSVVVDAQSDALREKVARAIMLHHDIDPDVFIGMHGGYDHWLNAADAALAAINEIPRQPTQSDALLEGDTQTILYLLGVRHGREDERAKIAAEASQPTQSDDEAYDLGKRDGYEKAVQDIDMLTGGDGEYCYSTIEGERHCPNPDSMKARIAERFNSQPTQSDALREENERLRALLARTVNLAEVYAEGTGTNFKEAMAEARAALQEQSK